MLIMKNTLPAIEIKSPLFPIHGYLLRFSFSFIDDIKRCQLIKFPLIPLLKFLSMILFVAHNVFDLNIQPFRLASDILEFDFQSALYIP